MTDSDRDLGRRWFEEVWNKNRREAIGEMMAPRVVLHDGDAVTQGPDAFYQFFDRMSATFSEMHVKVEETIAESDKLCVRWSSTAKHTGGGLGIAPTGLAINVTGISILRVADGRFVEAWQNWDMLGMMEQIQSRGRTAIYIGA